MTKLLTGHEKDPTFEFCLVSVTLTLELQTWVLRATHCLIKVNISAKSFKNPLTRKKRYYCCLLTSKCDLDLGTTDVVLRATRCLIKLTFLPIHFKIHRMAKLWTAHEKKPIFYIWPLSVTLTFALQTWVLRATHCVMMVNISAKSF